MYFDFNTFAAILSNRVLRAVCSWFFKEKKSTISGGKWELTTSEWLPQDRFAFIPKDSGADRPRYLMPNNCTKKWTYLTFKTTKEPSKLPTGYLPRKPEEVLGLLLDTHFFHDARIRKRSNMVDQLGRIKMNKEDWNKPKQIVTEDMRRWTVNTFMHYKELGPDDIYPVCLQEGLDITIKYLIEVFWGSLTMSH